jgi:hypothetical protein
MHPIWTMCIILVLGCFVRNIFLTFLKIKAYRFGILSKEQMEQMIEPLKQQLQNLQSSEKKHIH